MREHFPKADLDVLGEAYQFAAQAHHAQTRASGEPYINHSVTVAATLVDLRLDPVTIAAALLHDVAEDTGVTLNEVQAGFGTEIASLVDGVTKLGRIEWMSREERQAESLRKMFLAMASDIRIVLIKLADRLHNMRTIQYLPEWKQRRTSQETLDIYAPLAERLGIGRIQRELEDLAFAVLQPDSAQEVKNQLVQAEATRSQFLEQVADTLCRELNRAGLRVAREQVTARPKHVYSIWRKMQRPKYAGQPVARIYDRLGVRVIVDDVKDCYAALGVVHSLWKPIPGEFDDYIANPKTSGYQSLHTTVIYEGEPLEIQIRTMQMHREAEHGIAAHWRYKEGKPAEKEFEQKLSWLRQLLDWHSELQDARAFVQSVKLDLFQNEVFVFTPKGDVVDLPAGATPVDFAYRIHTDVGHRCVGAKVNGRLVPLSHHLHTGDIGGRCAGAGRRQRAHPLLPLLHAAPRRPDCRLCDAGARGDHSPPGLPQRQIAAHASGTADRGGVGIDPRSLLPGGDRGRRVRPGRPAERYPGRDRRQQDQRPVRQCPGAQGQGGSRHPGAGHPQRRAAACGDAEGRQGAGRVLG